MPKTLAEQIAGRCIHYNGAGNGPTCDAGVKYNDVRDDTVTKGWRLPCFRESVAKPCPKCEFPTPEAVAEQVQASETSFERSNSAMHACYEDAQHRGFRKGHGGAATIVCPVCGHGALHYSVASYNGHMHGRCETEGCVAWMQ